MRLKRLQYSLRLALLGLFLMSVTLSFLAVYWNTRAKLQAKSTTDLWLDKITSVADGFATMEEFRAKQLELEKAARGYGVHNSAIIDGWGNPFRTIAATDLSFVIVSSDGPNGVYENGLGDDRSLFVCGKLCDDKLRDLVWDINGSRRKLDHRNCRSAIDLLDVQAVDP